MKKKKFNSALFIKDVIKGYQNKWVQPEYGIFCKFTHNSCKACALTAAYIGAKNLSYADMKKEEGNIPGDEFYKFMQDRYNLDNEGRCRIMSYFDGATGGVAETSRVGTLLREIFIHD